MNSNGQSEKEFTIGFCLPYPIEPLVDDRTFLRSLCTFGAFLRWRIAKSIYETGLSHQDNEALRMALSLGIWEQLGAQTEDLLMFLCTVPKWVSSNRQDKLADLYYHVQIKAKGETSPQVITTNLQNQSNTDFLKSFGLPVKEDSWPEPTDLDNVRVLRTKLVGLLSKGYVVRSVLNKLKHGPQMIISSLPGPMLKDAPNLRIARLLLSGAKVAMSGPDDEKTHIYIEDSGESIPMAVNQIEFISRDLWYLASWVHYFSFGSFAHIDEKDNRFQPPAHWWSSKHGSTNIW